MNQFEKITGKIRSLEETIAWMKELRDNGKSIAFTNGCFDLLHRGHVTYLAQASDYADILILGLNSDNSVKRQNKGPERPINDEVSRALVTASLECVDGVVLFTEDTPENLIKSLIPDVLVKGADYNAEETNPLNKSYVVGSDIVRENGGKVITIPIVEGHSTTALVKKMKS